eukprot:scaffold2274_cov343-Pavlova_lutheri.AAC.4
MAWFPPSSVLDRARFCRKRVERRALPSVSLVLNFALNTGPPWIAPRTRWRRFSRRAIALLARSSGSEGTCRGSCPAWKATPVPVSR